uniref:(northern house mosquito) hypothetical protein n=1 Tax=Culex pipiens TaxID=7175 RepID=A0A8D8CMV4_CULPI
MCVGLHILSAVNKNQLSVFRKIFAETFSTSKALPLYLSAFRSSCNFRQMILTPQETPHLVASNTLEEGTFPLLFSLSSSVSSATCFLSCEFPAIFTAPRAANGQPFETPVPVRFALSAAF